MVIGLTAAVLATGHAFAIRQKVQDGPVVTPEDEARDACSDDDSIAKSYWRTTPSWPLNSRSVGRTLFALSNDGGLIDVNHVSENYLTLLPGISTDLATKIIEIRDSIGGFDSLDDMGMLVGLPPQRLESARTYAVFVR